LKTIVISSILQRCALHASAECVETRFSAKTRRSCHQSSWHPSLYFMSTPSVADFCLFLKALLQEQNGKLTKDGKNRDPCGNWNHETIAAGLFGYGFQMDALPVSWHRSCCS
jgi:hypothetical protein